jgi:hypothetical protein
MQFNLFQGSFKTKAAFQTSLEKAMQTESVTTSKLPS